MDYHLSLINNHNILWFVIGIYFLHLKFAVHLNIKKILHKSDDDLFNQVNANIFKSPKTLKIKII